MHKSSGIGRNKEHALGTVVLRLDTPPKGEIPVADSITRRLHGEGQG